MAQLPTYHHLEMQAGSHAPGNGQAASANKLKSTPLCEGSTTSSQGLHRHSLVTTRAPSPLLHQGLVPHPQAESGSQKQGREASPGYRTSGPVLTASGQQFAPLGSSSMDVFGAHDASYVYVWENSSSSAPMKTIPLHTSSASFPSPLHGEHNTGTDMHYRATLYVPSLYHLPPDRHNPAV